MKKAWKVWLIGSLVAVTVLGSGIAMAAEHGKQNMPMPGQMMMGNMDSKAMAEMMKTPEMQKQCVEMMKSPEMQQTMMTVIKQPEMQAAMKQMLQKDAGFHQMMLDLVNSVDMNAEHNHGPSAEQPPVTKDAGHSTHHL